MRPYGLAPYRMAQCKIPRWKIILCVVLGLVCWGAWGLGWAAASLQVVGLVAIPQEHLS